VVCHSPTILVNFAASYNTLAYYVSTGITQKINHNHDHRNQFLIKTTIISFFISGCLKHVHYIHTCSACTNVHHSIPLKRSYYYYMYYSTTTVSKTSKLFLVQIVFCTNPFRLDILINMIHNRPRAARHDLLEWVKGTDVCWQHKQNDDT